ncbi:hypothetical protein A2380_00440 [candidate division WWE3 bacterium RIFOXYB1_FULL_43_24]|nr:MAG: hypothetical protein A2380_00440 [candidate division WWE3 bacterium RIFOXYB1_FULL_43_24]OGC73608.1 MAG: hypothetical protein A2414_02220 [candidate division WWE3 bacterium RIFOXYC1_FULL_42_13]
MVTQVCTIKHFQKSARGNLKAVTFYKQIPVGTLFIDQEPLGVREVEFQDKVATLKIYRAYYKNEEVAFVCYYLGFEQLTTHEEIISVEEGKKLLE